MNKPELVLPAGDLEKLTTALLFGADAVYAGGKEFNLRAYAGNLTMDEISIGVHNAHQQGCKLYITVNILAHNRDIVRLPLYLEELASMEVDGLIVADPGVLKLARTYAPAVPVTVSTQANITNYESAALYRDLGASRIVLARELSLEEISEIKRRVEVELEVFIHGAMCVSYSGRCLLSHYMTGRNANSGACAHPCRYSYRVVEEKRPGQYFPIEEDQRGSYIFNSRDLCLISYLPLLIEAGIDAFKIEGRMKSPLYVATVTRIYRQAMDHYSKNRRVFSDSELYDWLAELNTVAARPFTSGFIEGETEQIMDVDKSQILNRAEFCGVVKSYDSRRGMVEVEQRGNFGPGDLLQILLPQGEVMDFNCGYILDGEGHEMDRARHPLQRVFIPCQQFVPEYSILRKVGEKNS